MTATVIGVGELTRLRIDRVWAGAAHEINIGRQITAALRAAYDQSARHSTARVIAQSRLGNVQRAAQDPLGLARRLRLSE